MKKKLTVFFVICLLIIIVVSLLNQKHKNNVTSTSESTTKKVTETTKKDVKEEDVTEGETIQTEDSTAKEEYEDNLDDIEKAEDPSKDRSSKETDELFRIALLFIDEYDLDSDDFVIDKALVVQDLTNDYLYMQYKSGDESAMTCYTYNGCYFREESQSVFKKEYEQALTNLNYDKEEDYGVYHSYSDDELKVVNNMF